MFVRGGYVYPGYILDSAGNLGYYWSSVGGNSRNAYLLYFSSGSVHPSDYDSQYYGFSVRCVALGGKAIYRYL